MDRKLILRIDDRGKENKSVIPTTPDLKRLGCGTGNENKLVIPATPDLTRLGYGTGVGVFHVSPENGTCNSPWALKKLLRGTKCNQTEMGKRLRKEADILRQLKHPNIVGFRAFLETPDGRECLAMEECHTSLCDLIEKQEEDVFPAPIIEKVAIEVAKALDYIHNVVHLLHGDVKSPNVLIKGNFDAIKLCDFGVTLPLKADGHLDTALAGDRAEYIGTRVWSAPEVCPEKTSPLMITDKADIFSYGLTLWEMMAKTTPHTPDILDETDSSFDEDAYEEMITELVGTRPDIPEYFKNIKEYENVVSLFLSCTESDYKIRFSAKNVLQFYAENMR